MSTMTQYAPFRNYQARLVCGDPVIVGYDKIVQLSKRWQVNDPMLSPQFLISQALHFIRRRTQDPKGYIPLVQTTSLAACNEISKLWDPLEQHLGRPITGHLRQSFFRFNPRANYY